MSAITNQPPVAIVGISALFPGSPGTTGFWRDILSGADNITDVPPSHWLIEDYYDPDPSAPDKTYCKRGGFLDPVKFDPLTFGVPPSAIPSTDTAQLLALIVARQVLEDASRSQFREIDKSRVSVILGVASTTEMVAHMSSRLQRPIWVKALREQGLPEDQVQTVSDRIADHYVPWREGSFPGLLGNVVTGRIANRLDLGGTNCVIDAACASSLSAIQIALRELTLGASDLVITGGVDALNDILMYMCFSKTPAFSPTGDCRPFSDRADGTIIGEGVGMFALRRLEDAERDGNHIYAVIRGMGSSSDGRSTSVYAPRAEGQALALQRAYDAAGYGPETVELVEAHGTGTIAGDAAEFAGLRSVFEPAGEGRRGWCALGSVKSQIGHTKAAAGAAGLFKIAMALHHKVLPPTAKVDRPNPKLDLDSSPFHLSTKARPWVRRSDAARRASVSSFGFGGSNFHVTLEEYTGVGHRPPRLLARPAELVVLSADSGPALVAACHQAGGSLAGRARQSQGAFDPAKAHRLAIVARSEQDLDAKLADAAERIASQPEAAFSTPSGVHYRQGAPAEGKIAFLFPGQGSQYVDMGASLAIAFESAAEIWNQAADLDLFADSPLHEVVFPPSAFDDEERRRQNEALTAMVNAQPAIAAVSLAQLRLIGQMGLMPDVLAGHSFGEVTALHAAGGFDRATTLCTARQRGALMTEAAAATDGAMIAVALERADLEAKIATWGLEVTIANDNAPRQVVLSGPVAAIEQAVERLAAKRTKAVRLPVASAFHSPIVAASSAPFQAFLEGVEVGPLALPVYANATAAPYPDQPTAIRRQLAEQLGQPVRFRETIEAMYRDGARLFVEIGPGSVLTGLVTQCLADRPHQALSLDRKGEDGVTALFGALAALAARGTALDYAPLWAGHGDLEEPAPIDAPHAITILGCNYGKPYPPAGGAADLPAPIPSTSTEARAPVETSATRSISANGASASGMTSGRAGHAVNEASPLSPAVVASLESEPLDKIAIGPSDHALTNGAARNGVAHEALADHGPDKPSEQPTAPLFASCAQGADDRWIATLEAFQRHTAQAHQHFQISMAESHQAFLRVAEQTLRGLNGSAAQEAHRTSPRAPHTEPAWPHEQPSPAPQAMAPAPVAAGASNGKVAPAEPEVALQAPPPAPPAPSPEGSAAVEKPAASVPPAAPAPAQHDLAAALLEVVAEKTGYPQDMLGLDMELEAGLGIDSIKQVEILSTLQERLPHLPEIDPSQLATLKTLGQIVAFMGEHVGEAPDVGAVEAPQAARPVPAPAAAEPPLQAPAPAQHDLAAALLEVVAEKTGYPQDMLGLDMELEASLGIDSIKQVEILSSLQERLPQLPEIDPSQLATLKTLGQIVAFMGESLGTSGTPDAKPCVDTPAAAASAQAEPVVAKSQAVPRFVLRAESVPPAGFAMPGLRDARLVAITPDGGALAEALMNALRERNVTAETRSEVPPDADAVIFLGALAPEGGTDDALAVHKAALLAAKAVAARFAERGGVFVTVQDTGGDFGLDRSGDPLGERAWLAGLPALVKTAALEWPDACVKAIDLCRNGRDDEALAVALADELLAGGPEIEVGLGADGRRIRLVEEAVRVDEGELALADDDVLVVSGGARGVTAATLHLLAQRRRLRCVILGRTPLEDEPAEVRGVSDEAAIKRALLDLARAKGQAPTPLEIGRAAARIQATREVRQTLAALETHGSKVRYLALDVRDRDAVAGALAGVRADWGPIGGLIHGAGVLADKRIEDKTEEQFDLVFGTKVEGLRALLDATVDDPLKAICLFSSVAARCGNVGQCDYAMANEVLNKVAQAEAHRRGDSCVVKAINWGPWDGGMVGAGLRKHFSDLGVGLIPIDGGAAFLQRELSKGNLRDVEVVAGSGALVPPRALQMEVEVDCDRHPYLFSHVIQDKPVLPMVLVMEWFVRAAHAVVPGLGPAVVHDLHALKGVILDDFATRSARFEIRAEPKSINGVAQIELTLADADGRNRYRAQVQLGPIEGGLAEPAPAPSSGEASPWPWQADEVYDGKLFHGPQFQVIRQLEEIMPDGGTGVFEGTLTKQWPGGPWATDPAALDGGMQLALLWGLQQTDQVFLPIRIGAFIPHGPLPAEEPLRCRLHSRLIGRSRTENDLTFTTLDGHMVAEMRDVEMYPVDLGPKIEA